MIKKGDFMKPNKKKETNYEKFMKLFNRSIKYGGVTRIALKNLLDNDEIIDPVPHCAYYKYLFQRRVRLYVEFDSINDFYDWAKGIEE